MSHIKYFSLLFLAACATSQPDLSIQTEPAGADIFYMNEEGREEKLGTSPLTLNDQLMNKFQSDNWRIGINKKGYVREQVFLETKMFKELGRINVRLLPEANWSEAYQDTNAYKYLNDVSSVTAEIQASTVKGDFPKAESLAQSLVTRYPKLSVGWNLLGNVYYLQKRVDKAIESYQKSLDVNPNDEVTKSILERLRGGRF